MTEAKTMMFRTLEDFEKYCYYECPIGKNPVKRIGCRLTCKIVMELRKKHPEWVGKKISPERGKA